MTNINPNRYINHAKKVWKAAFNKAFVYSFKEYLYHQASFSQEGEDCILTRIFEGQQNGFYVDVGAHHPQRFSNTYCFYLKGWRGINIDAMPGSMEAFKTVRPEDVNLEIPISNEAKALTFYMYNESALNTFSKETCERRAKIEGYPERFWITKELKLDTVTLAEVLDKYLPSNNDIDFMSVDVEGLDYEVLASNDWFTYRPEIVIVEDVSSNSIEGAQNSQVSKLMKQVGYSFFAKTVNSLFFKLDKKVVLGSDKFDCDSN